MAQTEIGKLIGEGQERDAIHIAVAPVIAGEKLAPGQGIALAEGDLEKVFASQAAIGIVDPFLTCLVFPGQRFWMFLLPNTITSLKHNWTHPAFENVSPRDSTKSASEEWLRRFADNVDANYEEMMRVAASHCDQGVRWPDYLIDGGKWEGERTPDDFWTHFAAVTGKTPRSGPTGIFSCSC